ncbi:MAG: hypothetical protein KF764_01055 [Labilithrix sp.]|nr:hypothetical protein [Labilithrix sp.]
MRRLPVTVLLAAALGSCGPDEPQFGAAGVILGKPLPRESAAGGPGGGPFGSEYSATANPADGTMLTAHQGTSGPQAAADNIDCLSCHASGGVAADKAFSFGGRVVRGGAPAGAVDVIVVSADGNERLGPVKSDAQGFFWLLGGPVPQGAKTHVRSSAGTESMGGALGAGVAASCDSANCHVPGKQNKVYAP